MTIRFRVTPAMFYGAQRAVMRQVKWMRLGGYFVLLLYPLFMIGITLAYGGTVIGAIRNNMGSYITLAIFWLVGIPLIARWTATRTLRNTPAFQGELEYSFAEEGIDIRTDVSTSHLGWASFIRGVETKDFFLLFQNKAMATFLPKSAFADSSERQAFRALASRHLAERGEWAAEPVVAPS